MDLATDIAGTALMLAGALAAGFEFRMLRSRFRHLILTPAAQQLRNCVLVICSSLSLVSIHWHNMPVTWSLIGLSLVLMAGNAALLVRERVQVKVVRVPRDAAPPLRDRVRVRVVRESEDVARLPQMSATPHSLTACPCPGPEDVTGVARNATVAPVAWS